MILDHRLDLLTLWRSANAILQMNTPFLMLGLIRDDSAYCFCRHALQMDWTESDLNFTLSCAVQWRNSNGAIKDRFFRRMESFHLRDAWTCRPRVARLKQLDMIRNFP